MILVTGGLGFIGLHTARALVDLGEHVVLSQFRAAREPAFIRQEVGHTVFVERLDVTDAERLGEVGRKYPITAILHLAVPGRGALGPCSELRTNMIGLINVFEAAERWSVSRIAVASSVAVYGGAPEAAQREDAWLPLSSASATEAFKKSFEVLSDYVADRTGLCVVSLRISRIWGPLYHSMWNLPSRAVHAAVKGLEFDPRTPTAAYADDGGDLCYVKDCARGISQLMVAPVLHHRTYNVGDGRATTNASFVAAVEQVIPGAHLPLLPGHEPNGTGVLTYQDLTRIHSETGYSPEYDTSEGVADYVAWLRAGNSE